MGVGWCGMGAHPRSRGENAAANCTQSIWYGSSPLTRGKPADSPAAPPMGWAHPRSRGENVTAGAALPGDRGSSPLTRGKPRPRLRSRSGERLIPAHAGKTLSRCSRCSPHRAHPRSRGENGGVNVQAIETDGSSPLTRGKRHHGVDRGLDEGLIPAHAGKTSSGKFPFRA